MTIPIMLPEITRRRYDDAKWVYFYNTHENKIQEEKSKNFSIGKERFTRETEDLIKEILEKKLAAMRQIIANDRKRYPDAMPQREEILLSAVATAINIQLLRNPAAAEYLAYQYEVYGLDFKFPYKTLYQDTVTPATLETILATDIYSNFQASPIKNTYFQRFFLPSTQFYTFIFLGTLAFIYIMAPSEAVMLLSKEHSNSSGLMELDNNTVDNLNQTSIVFDAYYGQGKIIGEEHELERLTGNHSIQIALRRLAQEAAHDKTKEKPE